MSTRIRSVSMKCDVPGCPGESPTYASRKALSEATKTDGWTRHGGVDRCPEATIHQALLLAELRAAYPGLTRPIPPVEGGQR